MPGTAYIIKWNLQNAVSLSLVCQGEISAIFLSLKENYLIKTFLLNIIMLQSKSKSMCYDCTFFPVLKASLLYSVLFAFDLNSD